ncbi:peptidylprolyl isomerase [Paenibacillus daejeonensis]|uniref:peptidylprolyl isomerase n=1 Tax=Paenibacillus daejeonensis TaxID=135193 RepID=UPI00039D26CC|nr:peptidylprolyl isomerase [Paenibacillus daejeonensis]
MTNPKVVRGLVALQAICMIVLAVVIVIQVLPADGKVDPAADPNQTGSGDSEQSGEGELPPSTVIATVGGESITLGELQQQLTLQYGHDLLRTMMVRQAIRLEVEASGITITDAELEQELQQMTAGYEDKESFYRAMEDQLGLTKEDVHRDLQYRLKLEKIAIRDIEVSDQEVDAYLQENKDQYAPRVQVRLSWIVTESRRLAEQAMDELAEGADFAKLADNYSTDDFTSAQGGDMGMIEMDDPFIEEAVLDAVDELAVGDITGPLQVDAGFAIIRLAERRVNIQPDERTIREMARKQLALSDALPLPAVEDQLLEKYEAAFVPLGQ